MANIFTYGKELAKQDIDIDRLKLRVSALEDKLKIYEEYVFQLLNAEPTKQLLDKIVIQVKDRLGIGG